MQATSYSGFRLSPQQRRLWELGTAAPEWIRPARCSILIEGDFDVNVLKAALHEIVRRHEILRTKLVIASGVNLPVQVVDQATLYVSESDWTVLDSNAQARQME